MTRKFEIDGDVDKGRQTICDTLRRLWRRARDNDDAVSMEMVADCFDYAKRMDARLRLYKENYIGPKLPRGGE